MVERDVPLEEEGELLGALARGLVLGAHQHVVEEEEVAQLAHALVQLHDERVLHQVAPLLLLRLHQLLRRQVRRLQGRDSIQS